MDGKTVGHHFPHGEDPRSDNIRSARRFIIEATIVA